MAALVRTLPTLQLRDAGVDDESDPYIRIGDGTLVYGHATPPHLNRFASLVPRALRPKLPPACLGLAIDVMYRYHERALMRHGPNKNLDYALRPGDTVIEMGAYIGTYLLWAARQVGERGRLVAIEPEPGNQRLLLKNITANGFKERFVPVSKGVWSTATTLRFQIDPNSRQTTSAHLHYSGGASYSVEALPLDDILTANNIDSVDMMIIQLNGAELEALKGLQRTQPRNLAIAARYGDRGGASPKQVQQLLTTRGYDVRIAAKSFVFAAYPQQPRAAA